MTERLVDRLRARGRAVARGRWFHALLLLATLGTTTIAGAGHCASFATSANPTAQAPSLGLLHVLATGLWYSVPLLLILGSHEMGHYVACRVHGVRASLPYFLPAPLPFTGTFGAVIRLRQRVPHRRALFDIGVAGPLAGLAVAIPVLVVGLLWSRVVPLPTDGGGVTLGEPLLFQGLAGMTLGPLSASTTVYLHPTAFAGWFGLLVTALNLLPVGQLDGGHIAFAVLGRHASRVSIATLAGVGLLAFRSWSWVVWGALVVLMLWRSGWTHAPTEEDVTPLGPGRLAVAILAGLSLVVCFSPVPIGLAR